MKGTELFSRPLLAGIELPDEICCGVDEVGRGCLAGPVVACAVILPAEYTLPGLDDSKKIPPKKRQILDSAIKQCALAWAIGVVGQKCIDRINILQATFLAMSLACSRLSIVPTVLYVDGKQTIPVSVLQRFWKKESGQLPRQKAVVHGDSLLAEISAASIVAKIYRDTLMEQLAVRWPEYGFECHKGYGTVQHRRMLAKYGPCPLHRRSFHCVEKEPLQSGNMRDDLITLLGNSH